MSDSQETPAPPNLVTYIRNRKTSREIYLENISSEMINVVREIGALFEIIDGEEYCRIDCANDMEVAEKLDKLNRLGFLFEGSPTEWLSAGWFDYFRKKKLLHGKFKEIRWRGPGNWFIIER